MPTITFKKDDLKMVDITQYTPQIAKIKTYEQSTDPRGDFLKHLADFGYTPPSTLRDGVIERIADELDKGTKKTGWYIYNQYDDVAIGTFSTWRNAGEKPHTWTSKDMSAMSFAERMKINDTIKANEAKRREEERESQNKVAQECYKEFSELSDATNENPYLKRKQVNTCPQLKARGDILYMPILDDGAIVSYQRIMPDGTKRMKAGGRKKGCYFIIEGDSASVYIAEGLATGLSVHQATGNTVYVAIDCGNLYDVSLYVKKKHAQSMIILAGENNDANKSKCEQMDLHAVFPPSDKHDDFNDMHVDYGMDALKDFLKPKKQPQTPKTTKPTNEIDIKFGGILDDIIDYYTATSGNDQPLFAIQTAIATCSVMLGRNFSTIFQNRTALYMLNLAKSGTGKEHGKKVIETILTATDNEQLIGGDGYTSAAAVISGLQMRPRHISIVDEFSKNIESANNKNSGGNLKEANAKLMEAFGRLDGTIRAKSYSMIGLTESKKKELANQYVVNPSLTLLCMSTPDDFFEHVGLRAIKDGFVNRFLVCISESERSIRKYKERMDVPQSIIDWDFKIKERIGQNAEIATDEPDVQTLGFDFACLDVQRAFEQKCIDLANKLEEFGLEDIPMRANEISMRISLIIALSENPDADTIQPRHIEASIKWVEYNLIRLVDTLKMSVSGSQFEADKKTILKALRKRSYTKSEMNRRSPFSRFEPRELNNILSALSEAGLIENQVEKTKGRDKVTWTAI